MGRIIRAVSNFVGATSLVAIVACSGYDYSGVPKDVHFVRPDIADVIEYDAKDNNISDQFNPDIADDLGYDSNDIVEDKVDISQGCSPGDDPKVSPCGYNGRGTQIEECLDGFWKARDCVDPDVCAISYSEKVACSTDISPCSAGEETSLCALVDDGTSLGKYQMVKQGDCDAEVMPISEVCGDGIDQDCNSFVDDGDCMADVEEGSFYMGCNPINPFCVGNDEKHIVYLDQFKIDRTEVTNKAFQQCVDAGDCAEPDPKSSKTNADYYSNPAFDNFPVIYVSWFQAAAYCLWAGKSLPTEAQWERAARGTDERKYPWGNEDPTCDLTAYNPCVSDVQEVGILPLGNSPVGASDMAGNVWEWVADYYGVLYYLEGSDADNNPQGPLSGNERIIRGGSINTNDFTKRDLYTFDRSKSDPDSSNFYKGFRCVFAPENTK